MKKWYIYNTLLKKNGYEKVDKGGGGKVKKSENLKKWIKHERIIYTIRKTY